MAAKNYFPVKRVSLGLNTRAPSTALAPGVLTVADNVEVRAEVLASAPGFSRISSATPDEYGYQLDGQTQRFLGIVEHQATTLQLASAVGGAFTVEVFFRFSRPPRTVQTDASLNPSTMMIAYKGAPDRWKTAPAGTLSSEFCWDLSLFSEGSGGGALGKIYARARVNWDSTGVETLDNQNLELLPDTDYHMVLVYDGADFSKLYVHPTGSALGTVETGAQDHGAEQPIRNTQNLMLGASPVGMVFTTLDNANVDFDTTANTITKSSGVWVEIPKVGSIMHVGDAANSNNGGFMEVLESTSNSLTFASGNIGTTVNGDAVTLTEFATNEIQEVHYGFHGIIQEFRVWSDERSSSELTDYDDKQFTDTEATAETDLVYYQRLTGAGEDTYYFPSTKGTAGSGDGQSPILSLEPRDGSWRGSGHTLGNPASGDYTFDMDGQRQGLAINSSYRYRSSTLSDDGAILFPDFWALTAKVTPRTLVDRATIAHYCPVDSDVYGYHWLFDADVSSIFTADGNAEFNVLLEVFDTGSSTFEFRAVVMTQTAGGTSIWVAEESSIGGLVAGTEYTVTVGVDSSKTQNKIYLYVNTTSNNRTWRADIADSMTITTTTSSYDTITTTPFDSFDVIAGDQIYVSGMANPENNGIKDVVSITAGTPDTLVVEQALTVETTTTGVSIHVLSRPPGTPKGDHQGARKYSLTLGYPIWRSRQDIALPGDPNGIEVWPDRRRTFDGQIQQVMIANPSQAWSFESLHAFNLAHAITRDSVAKVGLQISSCWLFDEGVGEVATDIASAGNTISVQEDPDHVWRQSIITTNNKDIIKALFEHRYRTAAGEQRKVVAVAGGTAFDLSLTTGTLTAISHGFRNDDLNLVSVMRHKDSSILCAGRGARGNYHLWKDELWRLDIKPPSGFIPFGLADQKNLEASLKKGVYRVAFTFYSSFTGKESPVGPVIEFEIIRGQANIAFGTAAEINQTHASTGFCDNKGPWDVRVTVGVSKGRTGFKVAAWIGPTGTTAVTSTDPDWWEEDPVNGPTSDKRAGRRKIMFARMMVGASDEDDIQHQKVQIEELESMDPDEFENVIDDNLTRAFVEVDPVGRVAVKSAWVGTDAQIQLSDFDTKASNPGVLSNGETMDWNAVTTAAVDYVNGTGTGQKDHGFGLPVSSDPQVTTLRMYRTLANDGSFRLAEEVDNGTTGFVHQVADELLVGAILDVTMGSPPAVEYVSDFSGRAIYIKDPDQPQRAYFSQPGEPWNVPAENVIDFLDGDTQALTGVGRTEGALMLFKDDTMFVLHPPTNALVPFSIETRLRDIGCVAPFSVTNVHDAKTERIFFAGEKGVYSFDTAFPDYLTNVIDNTYSSDISVANRDKIVAVHDRRNDAWLMAYPTGDTTLADGTVVNDRMLVLDYTVGAIGPDRYGWTRRTNLQVSIMSIIADTNDIDDIYFVDAHGFVYKYSATDTNYGVGTLTDRTLTSVAGTFSTTQVTVPQATLGSIATGHKGLFVTVVDGSDTTGLTRSSRLVLADDLASPSILTLDRALSFTPVAGDVVLVGSIESEAVFGDMSPYGAHIIHKLTDTFLRMTRETQSSSAIKWWWQGLGGVDGTQYEQDPPFSTVITEESVTFSNQKVDLLIGTPATGRRLVFRITSLGPDQPFTLREFTVRIEHGDDGARLDVV